MGFSIELDRAVSSVPRLDNSLDPWYLEELGVKSARVRDETSCCVDVAIPVCEACLTEEVCDRLLLG